LIEVGAAWVVATSKPVIPGPVIKNQIIKIWAYIVGYSSDKMISYSKPVIVGGPRVIVKLLLNLA
jgi:hypothetical protein